MIKTLVQGNLQTNTYLISNETQAVLIDPTGNYKDLINVLNNKELIGILLTHGHFDHLGAVDDLYDVYKCPIYLHKNDKELATTNVFKESFGNCPIITKPILDMPFDKFNIGDFTFDVHHTPGHTPGSILIQYKNSLFTGDTLFKDSIGRTDLYLGDFKQIKESLKYIQTMDKNLIVYPGHGPLTSIEDEIRNNPYL